MGEKGTRGKDLFCLLEGAKRSSSQETATEHIWISRVLLVHGPSRVHQSCCYRVCGTIRFGDQCLYNTLHQSVPRNSVKRRLRSLASWSQNNIANA